MQPYAGLVDDLAHSFDGIYVADGSGNTLWMNHSFELCYGMDAAEFVGRHARELERRGYVRPLITPQIIESKKRITALQQTMSGKRVLATGTPVLDGQGNVRKVIINVRDTTEFTHWREPDSSQSGLALCSGGPGRIDKAYEASDNPVFADPRMQEIVGLAHHLAKLDATLLLTGESGVGKDVIAKLVHRNSPRSHNPLIHINCAAIPEQLLESELFGYEQGAFTGSRLKGKPGLLELADHGTLFLDEIGELALPMQAKLLRVLQDKAITRVGGIMTIRTDFRLIAATNQNLVAMVESKLFRTDLYYRLNVVPIEIPPLRERTDDIVPLAERFLAEFREKYRIDKTFATSLLRALEHREWRGNVRELRNLVERLVVSTTDLQLTASHLPKETRARTPNGEPFANYRAHLAKLEADFLRQAISHHGSIRRAADFLVVSESTIKRRLKAGESSGL